MSPTTLRIQTRTDDFQLLEVLSRNRKKRSKLRQFLVEGVQSINLLLANEWKVESFVYSPERKRSSWAKEILSASRAARHIELADELMAELSDRDETSELIAVARMPERGLGDIPTTAPALIVVVDRPANPGNLGTLIRSCDALDAQGVVLCGHAVDPFDPRTIRASAGSLFALPVISQTSTADLTAWLDRLRNELAGLKIVGSSAGATTSSAAHDFLDSTVLVIGNERSGLSRAFSELCDEIVAIPMSGSVSSLNVSCGASILLYEIGRQRRARSQ